MKCQSSQQEPNSPSFVSMLTWSRFQFVHFVRQALCLLVCALFVVPTFAVQPSLATSGIPLPEEREESKKSENADDDSSLKDSINQANRRAVSQRSPVEQSIQTDTARKPAVPSPTISRLKDVYQNGLGTRLRC
jgi:hypothetical protein